MSKINWDASRLPIAVILEALFEGNKNLSEDENFISTLSDILTGNSENMMLKDYGSLYLRIMYLDENNIRGDLLEKLWNLCDKDIKRFCGVLSYTWIFDEEVFRNNLLLDKPVFPIDEKVFSKYPSMKLLKMGTMLDEKTSIEDYIDNRFVEKYNQEVDAEYAPLPKGEIKEAYKEPAMSDDFNILLKDLYFGVAEYDVTGGVLGLNVKKDAWFLNTNETCLINDVAYAIFREIPSGEYIAVDENGALKTPEKTINVNDEITLLPNHFVRSLQFNDINSILSDAKNRDEDNKPVEVEVLDFYNKMNNSIRIDQLNDLEKVVKPIYEYINDNQFDNNDELNKIRGI